MVDTDARVLVVGAGIAGLAVARTLRRAGFAPDVVEKLPAAAIAGAGIYLPGNGARALRELGLHEEVRPYGSVITRQRLFRASGAPLADIDVVQLWGAVGECRALHRADLHRLMTVGAGEVRHETPVTDLEIGDGSAKVTFGDGSAAEYDVVVAADGRRSQLRSWAGLGGAARPVGQVAYRAIVTGGPDIDAWSAWLGGATSCLAMPIGEDRLYVYVDELAPRGQRPTPPEDPLARVRELLGGYGGPVPDLLAHIDKVAVAVIEEVDVPRWVAGSVVLIGDAAHATSPNMAQGAAMGMEDAVALAEELTRGRDVPAALAAFEERRRARAAWVLAQTHSRDRARYLPAVLRNTVMRWRAEAMFRHNYGPLLAAP